MCTSARGTRPDKSLVARAAPPAFLRNLWDLWGFWDRWDTWDLWDLCALWEPWGLWVLFGLRDLWDLRNLCAPGSRLRLPRDSLTDEAPARGFPSPGPQKPKSYDSYKNQMTRSA